MKNGLGGQELDVECLGIFACLRYLCWVQKIKRVHKTITVFVMSVLGGQCPPI